MFIDYVTLMLLNMIAGLFIFAHFLLAGYHLPNKRGWTPGFAVVGLIGLVCGFHMTLTWPITEFGDMNLRFANIAFGEMTVVLGGLFAGAALTSAFNWSFRALGIYAFFAGIAAIVVGAGIAVMGLTQSPILAGIGFVLTGLTGILFGVTTFYFENSRRMHSTLAALLIAAGVIWCIICYMSYWIHLERFSTSS